MLNGVSHEPPWVDSINAPAGVVQRTLDVPITSAMCDRAGRLRLDSLARLCEMISVASGESGLRGPTLSWVVRTTSARVMSSPMVGEWVRIAISTSGWGPAWIERRIVLDACSKPGSGARPAIVVSTVWVSFDRNARRPSRLDRDDLSRWQDAANGRRVGAAHLLTPIPASPQTVSLVWPIRHCDVDLQGHLNNAAALSPCDDALAGEGLAGRPGLYRAEYRAEVDRSDQLTIERTRTADGLVCQLVVAGDSANPAMLFAAHLG